MRKIKTGNLLLLSCFCLAVNTGALAGDLAQVYADAVSNNFRLQSASIDYQLSTERRNEIESEYDPELTLRISPTFALSSQNKPSSLRLENTSAGLEIDYALSFEKPIYHQEIDTRLSA